MKKLIAVALILAMLLPVTVAAAATDHLIGSWYLYYDKNYSPEMASNFEDADRVIMILTFNTDGTIMLTENDVYDEKANVVAYTAGKWERVGNKYNCSIMGFGEGTLTNHRDYILLTIDGSKIGLKFWHLKYFDPYSDYVYQ